MGMPSSASIGPLVDPRKIGDTKSLVVGVRPEDEVDLGAFCFFKTRTMTLDFPFRVLAIMYLKGNMKNPI